MSEWLKTILTVVIGLVLGLISSFVIEPAKLRLLRRRDAKDAAENLYKELGTSYNLFCSADDAPEQVLEYAVKRLTFEVFDFYYNQKRDIFYAIPDRQGIRTVHGQFALNLDAAREGRLSPRPLMQELREAVEYLIETGELDGERIIKFSREHEQYAQKNADLAQKYLQKRSSTLKS